jgi:hypothetical protein
MRDCIILESLRKITKNLITYKDSVELRNGYPVRDEDLLMLKCGVANYAQGDRRANENVKIFIIIY